jgi:hypothetical protein
LDIGVYLDIGYWTFSNVFGYYPQNVITTEQFGFTKRNPKVQGPYLATREGHGTQDMGNRKQDLGHGTQDIGLRTQDSGPYDDKLHRTQDPNITKH